LNKETNKMRKCSEGLLDVEMILNNLQIYPGQTILDAGCGNGYMSKRFSELVGNNGRVYALDPDKEAINNLKKEVEKTNIEPLVGDITKTTELKDCSIDLIYLSTVFHIFSDDQVVHFEKEIKRILRPKAKLAIVNIKKENTPFGPPIEMRSSPEELKQKLSFTPKQLIEVGEYFYMQIFEKI